MEILFIISIVYMLLNVVLLAILLFTDELDIIDFEDNLLVLFFGCIIAFVFMLFYGTMWLDETMERKKYEKS